ncbi:MAG: hypothetical protein WCD86_22615 [Ktedonobacteraceae bacterium]|nr:hypothetical protein [Ktedonobacterales bacterium]
MTNATASQSVRIRIKQHRDNYWYLWRNGKRIAHTAYGDKTAAERAARQLREREQGIARR